MAYAFKKDMLEMGTRIKNIRTYKEMSLERLAKLVKITPQELLQIESGKISPDIITVVAISDALEAPLSAIQPEKLDKHMITVPSKDFNSDFLSDFHAQKEFNKMLGNPYETLSNCLYFMMDAKGLKTAKIFWEKTLLNRNFFSAIKGNRLKEVTKETLMAVCVGLELRIRMVEKVFHKAGLLLNEYETPDGIYIFILENIPGLGIDEFNNILIVKGQKPLGTQARK